MTCAALARDLGLAIAAFHRHDAAPRGDSGEPRQRNASDDTLDLIDELKAALSRAPVKSSSDLLVAVAIVNAQLEMFEEEMDQRKIEHVVRRCQRMLQSAANFLAESGAEISPNTRGYFISKLPAPRSVPNAA